LLSATDISLSYGDTTALAKASAVVAPGEVLALVGPSGSGKSTMLYCLAGLLKSDSGVVELDGRDLCRMSDDERSDVRRQHFGFVFQFADLVPELTLRENIELPLILNKIARRERRTRVDELLERLGLTGEAERRPAFVSGGQAQRAAVARAIVHRPAVLFADEPTGALDTDNGALVFDALLELADVTGSAVVLVTHDNTLAARAHRVVLMRDGRTGEGPR
jgi:putative ABC transport system ATP-binding protein